MKKADYEYIFQIKIMHRLFILFVIVLFSIPANSQKSQAGAVGEFCKQLAGIMSHASSNFDKINTGIEQDAEEQVGDGFNSGALERQSKLILPGAQLSSVYPPIMNFDLPCCVYDPQNFTAYFGIYETFANASNKLDSIKRQLTGCLENYESTNEPVDKDEKQYPIRWLFKEKRSDNKPAQKLELRVEKIVGYKESERLERFKVRLILSGISKNKN